MPAFVPCPPWCERANGHPFVHLFIDSPGGWEDDGPLERYHCATLEAPAGFLIALDQVEHAVGPAGPIERTPVQLRIAVDHVEADLSLEQTRELLDALAIAERLLASTRQLSLTDPSVSATCHGGAPA